MDKELTGIIVCAILFGIMIGYLIGGFLSTRNQDNLLNQEYKTGYNDGWNELRDNWINSLIGLEDDCYYETNENNTMKRYVCGELTNGWRKIE